jgi:hypothetical protein
MRMHIMFGLGLIAFAAALILVARPRDGASASLLKVWIVGQFYALTAMLGAVTGISLIISNLPG